MGVYICFMLLGLLLLLCSVGLFLSRRLTKIDYIFRPGAEKGDETKKLEHRLYPRLSASLRVEYRTPLRSGVSWILNISHGGFQLLFDKKIKVCTPLEMTITLPPSNKINVKGSVVWARGIFQCVAGVSFQESDVGKVEDVVEYLEERLRMTRAKSD